MERYYFIMPRFSNTALEIATENYTWNDIQKKMRPCETKQLLRNVPFYVKSGKKSYDQITIFESFNSKIFSQRFIDIISQYIDMSDKCYPIEIADIEIQYYVLYNLNEYFWFNDREVFFGKPQEPHMFLVNNIRNIPSLFTFMDTKSIVVDNQIKVALIKAKLTNIRFEDAFGCTQEEYEEWKLKHLKTDSLKS